MQGKRGDRRVNRTRRLLRESLMSLILERGYDAVTVEEITNRADVGRTTFYLHYKDKEDLLVESINTAINDLVVQISNLPVSSWAIPYDSLSPQDSPRSPILLVFQHASDNADLYRIILRGEGSSRAQNRIRDVISDAVNDFLSMKARQEGMTVKPVIPLEVFSIYFAGSLLGILTWWLEADMPFPTSQIASMFEKLAFPGARDVLGITFRE